MQHKHLQFGYGFKVVLGNEHSQAAQMTLAPGEMEGGPDKPEAAAAASCSTFTLTSSATR
jgi:hypothetical protein